VYLTKTVFPTSVQLVGDQFTFQVTVGLNSLNPAQNVQMIDNVPGALTILDVTEIPDERGGLVVQGSAAPGSLLWARHTAGVMQVYDSHRQHRVSRKGRDETAGNATVAGSYGLVLSLSLSLSLVLSLYNNSP